MPSSFSAKIMDLVTDRYVWAKPGGDLTLDCDAKGYPAPVITWVKDKKVIQSGSNSLQLRDFKTEDNGFYECWANNTHGFDAKLYEVNMTSKQNSYFKQPETPQTSRKLSFIILLFFFPRRVTRLCGYQ